MNHLKKIFAVFLLMSVVLCETTFARNLVNDDEIIEALETSLATLPTKITRLKSEVRRINFYSIRVDREDISQQLLEQIQGKIESAFLKIGRPILVFTPEIKPMKIISTEEGINFASGFRSTSEIKEISEKLKLDGFLKGELILTGNNMFLNLRIFESNSMAVVWSEEFSTVTVPDSKFTGIDFGFGVAGLLLSETPTSIGADIPQYADYYIADIRITQKTPVGEKMRFVLNGGVLCLNDGIKSSLSTIVSSEKNFGSFSFILRTGIRVSIIPILMQEAGPKRDWLATEITFGRIFGAGTNGLSTLGIKAESNIAKDISITFGVSFIPITKVSFATGKEVNVGGFSYEISLLRFNFMP
ncbi:MAG: hypothetical protein ABID79_00110 [Elusimicrobiota bacterium]